MLTTFRVGGYLRFVERPNSFDGKPTARFTVVALQAPSPSGCGISLYAPVAGRFSRKWMNLDLQDRPEQVRGAEQKMAIRVS